MTEKLYLHPITRDRFIPKSEYFQLLNSKLYDTWLDTLDKNKTVNNTNTI